MGTKKGSELNIRTLLMLVLNKAIDFNQTSLDVFFSHKHRLILLPFSKINLTFINTLYAAHLVHPSSLSRPPPRYHQYPEHLFWFSETFYWLLVTLPIRKVSRLISNVNLLLQLVCAAFCTRYLNIVGWWTFFLFLKHIIIYIMVFVHCSMK